MHHVHKTPEKNVNLYKNFIVKPESERIYNYEGDNHGNDVLFSNWGRNKCRRKGSKGCTTFGSNNESRITAGINNDNQTRGLDLIMNFNKRKKNPNYLDAYYTESDLSKRKMFHETKNVQSFDSDLNIEVQQDTENNSNTSRCSHQIYSASTSKQNYKMRMTEAKRMNEELEDLFNLTCSDFETDSSDDNILKDFDICFQKSIHNKKKKRYFYNQIDVKESTISSKVKRSNINLLFKNRKKFKTNEIIVTNDNFTEESLSSMYLKKKMSNEISKKFKIGNKILTTKAVGFPAVNKVKTYLDLTHENKKISTNSKSSFVCSKSTTLTNNENISFELNTDKYSVCLRDNFNSFNDTSIPKNILLYENSEKESKNPMTETTISSNIYFNEEYFNSIVDSSCFSIVDYSISEKRQHKKNNSSIRSTKMSSNRTVINYNCCSKRKNENKNPEESLHKIHLKQTKSKNCNKRNAYKDLLLKRKSKDYLSNTESNCSFYDFYNFDKQYRKYLIDKHSHEFCRRKKSNKTQRSSKSEPTPDTFKYYSIIQENDQINLVNNSILKKNFDEIIKASSNMYNRHSPFSFKVIETESSHKLHFKEHFLPQENCNLDDSFLKLKEPLKTKVKLSNKVPLKLSISNMNKIIKNRDCDIVSKNMSDKIDKQKKESSLVIYQKNTLFNREGNNLTDVPLSFNSTEEINYNRGVKEMYRTLATSENFEWENPKINKSFPNEILSNNETISVHVEEIENSNQMTTKQLSSTKINNALLQDSSVTSESRSSSANCQSNLIKYRTSIEVLFPVRSKRNNCCSHATKTTTSTMISVDSSKLRTCKSDTSQYLEKTNLSKNITERNITSRKPNSPKNDEISLNYLEKRKKSNKDKKEDDLVKDLDSLLKSPIFRSEVECIVQNYLMNNVIVKLAKNRRGTIIVAKDVAVKYSPQNVIGTLAVNKTENSRNKLKYCTYKIHKSLCNVKSVKKSKSMKGHVIKNRNIERNSNVEQRKILDKSEETYEDILQKDKLSKQRKNWDASVLCNNYMDCNLTQSEEEHKNNLQMNKPIKRHVSWDLSEISNYKLKEKNTPNFSEEASEKNLEETKSVKCPLDSSERIKNNFDMECNVFKNKSEEESKNLPKKPKKCVSWDSSVTNILKQKSDLNTSGEIHIHKPKHHVRWDPSTTFNNMKLDKISKLLNKVCDNDLQKNGSFSANTKLKQQNCNMNYSKFGNNKTEFNSNKSNNTDKRKTFVTLSYKNNDIQRNYLKNKMSKNVLDIDEQERSTICEELDMFKKILSDLERKQNVLLNLLKKDSCGLVFNLPDVKSVIKKSKEILKYSEVMSDPSCEVLDIHKLPDK